MEEGKKRSSSKKAAKQVVIEEESSDLDAGKKQQEFVENMKKRATVKKHGIDNVSSIISKYRVLGCNL